ncbi:hypothetical protein CSUI_004519, partial [Cystoisospora suis]
MPTFPDTNSQ